MANRTNIQRTVRRFRTKKTIEDGTISLKTWVMSGSITVVVAGLIFVLLMEDKTNTQQRKAATSFNFEDPLKSNLPFFQQKHGVPNWQFHAKEKHQKPSASSHRSVRI